MPSLKINPFWQDTLVDGNLYKIHLTIKESAVLAHSDGVTVHSQNVVV